MKLLHEGNLNFFDDKILASYSLPPDIKVYIFISVIYKANITETGIVPIGENWAAQSERNERWNLCEKKLVWTNAIWIL